MRIQIRQSLLRRVNKDAILEDAISLTDATVASAQKLKSWLTEEADDPNDPRNSNIQHLMKKSTGRNHSSRDSFSLIAHERDLMLEGKFES